MPGPPAVHYQSSLRQPSVHDVRRGPGDRVTLQICVPAAEQELGGHFPDFPIVPGVLLVAWAIELASRSFDLGTFIGVSSAKFRRPLRPGDEVSAVLEWHADSAKLRYVYRLHDVECARGTVEFVRGDV